MQKLYISPTAISPEIHFSPDDNIFIIKGTSAPEDVRALYYPVTEWIASYVIKILNKEITRYSTELPFTFKADMEYFNSSSAKFIYDIFLELKKLVAGGIPVTVEWLYDEEDIDMKEAGSDIALLAGMEFSYIPKSS